MKEARQQLEIHVEGSVLCVRRIGKRHGQAPKWQKWHIQKKSNLPRGLYFVIHNFVRTAVGQRPADDLEAIKKSVLRGLCQAAVACGCEPKFGKEGGDLCWYSRGRAIIAFQVHEGEVHGTSLSKMRAGCAVFRWAITIKKGGFVRYDPRRTKVLADMAAA